jgi:hypothetical protein
MWVADGWENMRLINDAAHVERNIGLSTARVWQPTAPSTHLKATRSILCTIAPNLEGPGILDQASVILVF